MQAPNASPLNPVAPVVWALALPLIAMEIVLQAGEAGLAGGNAGLAWRLMAAQELAFVPDYWRQMWQTSQWPLDGLQRLLGYVLVSMSLTQSLFQVVMILALGKFVSGYFRAWAIAALFLAGALTGALAYGALPNTHLPLTGAYPAIYALIGGYTFVLWQDRRLRGENPLGAFRLILYFMALRLVFGLGAWAIWGQAAGSGLDWVAELAGFGVGFLLSFPLIPGGWRRLRQRIRRV